MAGAPPCQGYGNSSFCTIPGSACSAEQKDTEKDTQKQSGALPTAGQRARQSTGHCAYEKIGSDVGDKVFGAEIGRHQHPYCTLLGGDSDCWRRTPSNGCSGMGTSRPLEGLFKIPHSSSPLWGNIA